MSFTNDYDINSHKFNVFKSILTLQPIWIMLNMTQKDYVKQTYNVSIDDTNDNIDSKSYSSLLDYLQACNPNTQQYLNNIEYINQLKKQIDLLPN